MQFTFFLGNNESSSTIQFRFEVISTWQKMIINIPWSHLEQLIQLAEHNSLRNNRRKGQTRNGGATISQFSKSIHVIFQDKEITVMLTPTRIFSYKPLFARDFLRATFIKEARTARSDRENITPERLVGYIFDGWYPRSIVSSLPVELRNISRISRTFFDFHQGVFIIERDEIPSMNHY